MQQYQQCLNQSRKVLPFAALSGLDHIMLMLVSQHFLPFVPSAGVSITGY